MSRILWLNPVFGVSGDMTLGALFGLGADLERVRATLGVLDLSGWDLAVESVSRRGLEATRAVVISEPDVHRSWSEIDSLLEDSPMSISVKDGARSTFRVLAEIEALRHDVPIDDVHFHEVGAIDAIVDIVGSWAALDSIDVDAVHSGSIGLGAGMLVASHGSMPNPAPAVLGLLEGLPVTAVQTEFETATPTGVALLRTMVDNWGGIPEGSLVGSGFGAGGRDPESHANMLAAVIIEAPGSRVVDAVALETNVDDVTPEVISYVIETALSMGADDAWTIPVVMKKGRPGHEIHILCPPGLSPSLAEMLAKETGTLGIRSSAVRKQVFPRTYDTVEVDGYEITIKSGPYGAKPEFEDVKRVAVATSKPMVEVGRAALAAWRSRVPS